jgi:hypothetical protein
MEQILQKVTEKAERQEDSGRKIFTAETRKDTARQSHNQPQRPQRNKDVRQKNYRQKNGSDCAM